MKPLPISVISPNALYNILNEHLEYPAVSDPNYILLLDSRIKTEYEESHIVLSKRAKVDSKDEFIVPYDGELECKDYVVVYDGQTSSVEDTDSRAFKLARLLAEMGSRNPVLILEGGYERFSAVYPFLRTQKVLWLPQELDAIKTYPFEVIPGFLYVGTHRQGSAPYIQKDLKIKAHVCVDKQKDEFFPEPGPQLLQISVGSEEDADLSPFLAESCSFIAERRKGAEPVLVFSNLGISRAAAVVIAYLMSVQTDGTSVEAATEVLKQCTQRAAPTTKFFEQLEQFKGAQLQKSTA